MLKKTLLIATLIAGLIASPIVMAGNNSIPIPEEKPLPPVNIIEAPTPLSSGKATSSAPAVPTLTGPASAVLPAPPLPAPEVEPSKPEAATLNSPEPDEGTPVIEAAPSPSAQLTETPVIDSPAPSDAQPTPQTTDVPPVILPVPVIFQAPASGTAPAAKAEALSAPVLTPVITPVIAPPIVPKAAAAPVAAEVRPPVIVPASAPQLTPVPVIEPALPVAAQPPAAPIILPVTPSVAQLTRTPVIMPAVTAAAAVPIIEDAPVIQSAAAPAATAARQGMAPATQPTFMPLPAAPELAPTITATVPVNALPSTIASTSYFPVLPFDAAPDAEPQLVPLASNHAIDGSHKGLTRAVIVIHDFSRDAQATMTTVSSLIGSANGNTIIIAPQFLLDFDISRFKARLPEGGHMFARWQLGNWENGGNSIAVAPNKPISSFTVVDLLMLYLSDKQYFPNMAQITIAGHGAGGDFVQRYAAAGRAADIIGPHGPAIRYLVANPSSYLYLTASRPHAGKAGFGAPEASSNCADYNGYPYGLGKLNDYAQRVGESAIKLSYAARPVTYLVGEKVAINDPLPDESCAAILEGQNRVVRAANYDVYLYQTFGDEAAQNHHFTTVPGAGYDPAALFGSSCGLTMLLGNGVCKAPAITGAKNR